jgi:hypothetical protein
MSDQSKEHMTMSDVELDGSDLGAFSKDVGAQIESFLIALGAVARGDFPDGSLSILLLELSQLMLAGGRLGAIVDVVPVERFESDTGIDPDADGLRERLSSLLDGIDEYAEVFDPYDPEREVVPSKLSDDLADVATDLLHGLRHYQAGRPIEALWWWQFSYLSNWGATGSSALRALHSAVAHTRLDVSQATGSA